MIKKRENNLLCIPIIAQDTESAIGKISEAQEHADILELRLDLMTSFDQRDMLEASGKPVIVTYRSEKEGGQGKLAPSVTSDYLIDAVHAGAEYIDIELSMPVEYREKILRNKGRSRVIISTHIIQNTPPMDDLSALLDESASAGGDVVKIVTMANSMDDNLRMLELVSDAKNRGIEIIAFCMGALGRMSRIFTLLMGGYLSFTSLDSGEESAPGQIPVKEMKQLLEYFST